MEKQRLVDENQDDDVPPDYDQAISVAQPPVPIPMPTTSRDSIAIQWHPSIPHAQPHEGQVRAILLEYCMQENCCPRPATIAQMNIRDISKLPVYRYKLDTFIEKRIGHWRIVPYDGTCENVIGPSELPKFWDFPIVPDIRFKDSRQLVEIPNTTSISTCPRCQGAGRTQCHVCGGSGSIPCRRCCGSGHRGHRRCLGCFGIGRQNCLQCAQNGIRNCPTCAGSHRVKTYFELEVIWTNLHEESVSVNGSLRSEYWEIFKDLKSRTKILTKQSHSASVLTIAEFPDLGVHKASQIKLQRNMKDHHKPKTQQCIEFRQIVEEIPATIVQFSWKGKEGEFLICGLNNNYVYFPDFNPLNLINCCAIL